MTTTVLASHEIHDPRRLADRARELGLPGSRSMTAIRRLRANRRANHPQPSQQPGIAERLHARLVDRYTFEITRRGGEAGIATGNKASDLRELPLRITDRRAGLVLLHVEGWRYYSRAYGSRRARLSYLCGRDDSGDWAVRVPGTMTTVTAALEWITPAQVTQAIAANRRVDRQGDIYAIATTAARDTATGWVGTDARRDDNGQMVTSHWWDADTRTLTHRPADGRTHRPLHLPHPVRFLQQRAYAHGRGNQWATGD